ncbi:MAG: hypothetical protein L6R42_010303 [Xanthoria sp. 1 TBL-2021]|nr:MAG: hypothetical protein L6R42_010303 [Xanthoria sp. 1 TBL-2021]
MPTGSQDSSGSSDSTYSANTYPSSYNVSPAAYSPTETYGYSPSQVGYLAPSHGQYHPTAQPTSSTYTSAQQSKSLSPTSTSTSKPTPFICVFPGCTRQFARTYDLDRHMKVHFPDSVGKLDCPQGAREGSFCKRVGEKGFTRKDHRDEHLRKVHMIDLPKSARGTRN